MYLDVFLVAGSQSRVRVRASGAASDPERRLNLHLYSKAVLKSLLLRRRRRAASLAPRRVWQHCSTAWLECSRGRWRRWAARCSLTSHRRMRRTRTRTRKLPKTTRMSATELVASSSRSSSLRTTSRGARSCTWWHPAACPRPRPQANLHSSCCASNALLCSTSAREPARPARGTRLLFFSALLYWSFISLLQYILF